MTKTTSAKAFRALATLLWLLCLFSVIAGCQTPASASDAGGVAQLADASLEDLMNSKVYAASRYEQTVSEAPASVTVVTRDEIQRYGYRTLADILRSVPGFFIPNDKPYDYVGVRGFANPGDYNTRVLLLVDGHRLNDSIFEQAMIGTEFPVDVDMIERVEVIRGPASSIYGTNAIFGVINVITRKVGELSGVEVSGDAASLNTYRGRVSYGGRVCGISTVLSATYMNSKGANELFFPAYDDPADNNGYASHADGSQYTDLLATLSARGFTFQALYGSREKHDPTGAWAVVFNDPRNRVTDTHGYFDLRYEHSIGSWQWMARTYYDRYGEDGFYIEPNPGSSSIVNRDFERGEQWGTDLQVSKSIHSRLQLTAGGEYRDQFREEMVNYNVSPQQLLVNVNIPYYVLAGYVQGELKLTDKLSLTAGLRQDYNPQVGASTSPRVALRYEPREATTFKLIYGTAFRSPNVYEQYYASLGFDSQHRLEPEQIQAWEGVWQQSITSRTTLSASLFHNRMSDFIEFTTDAEGVLNFRNIPDAVATGGEVELRGQWSGGTTAHASYSYQ